MSIEKTLTIEFDEDENWDDTIGCLEYILNDHDSVKTYDWGKKTENAPTKTAEEFFSALANLCSQARVSITGDLGDEITVTFRGHVTFIARWDRNNKVFKFWPEGEEEKEEKKPKSSETVIRDVRIDPCPENVEYAAPGNFCCKQSVDGWACIRKSEHSGPHHAHSTSTRCCFVWEEADSAVCVFN